MSLPEGTKQVFWGDREIWRARVGVNEGGEVVYFGDVCITGARGSHRFWYGFWFGGTLALIVQLLLDLLL